MVKVSRGFSTTVQTILDDYLPPVLRDSRLFMSVPVKLVFKDKAHLFLDFKHKAHAMSDKEFSELYEEVSRVDLQGETDLNKRCEAAILSSLKGKNVLEVGCGRGYLADKLAQILPTTAVDIVVPKSVREKYKHVTFKEANIEKLPFKDASFDTVITTHTLEHVQNLPKAIEELRRVTKERLIIVVPRQRPYNHNFSLHINFFSHAWSFPALLGYRPNTTLERLGDWFYMEDMLPKTTSK